MDNSIIIEAKEKIAKETHELLVKAVEMRLIRRANLERQIASIDSDIAQMLIMKEEDAVAKFSYTEGGMYRGG